MVDHGTRIEFFGGLGVIGGSKVCVSTPRARVVFDCGSDIAAAPDLFRPPVVPRAGRELHDLVATGQTRWIPGVFDPVQRPGSVPDDPDAPHRPDKPDHKELALFVSHAHVDHDGLLGHLRDGLAVHASPETVELHRALALAGRGPTGRAVRWESVTGPVTVGDLTVELVPVDHDVPGACAILVHTPDGLVAYTGDINFHRGGGLASRQFVDRARRADVLLSEATTLSSDHETQIPTEAEILGRFTEVCTRPGLQLVSLYERDLDRVRRWLAAARDHGRRVVWPGAIATVLAASGLDDILTWDRTRPQSSTHHTAVAQAVRAGLDLRQVSLTEVKGSPDRFVVQPDPDDPAAMLDLPIGATTVWVHSQGEPLGPFMPNWGPFTDWLEHLQIATVQAGSSGHASPADLQEMVERIDPQVLFPFHGFRPERLVGPRTTVLASYGVQYHLDGSSDKPLTR